MTRIFTEEEEEHLKYANKVLSAPITDAERTEFWCVVEADPDITRINALDAVQQASINALRDELDVLLKRREAQRKEWLIKVDMIMKTTILRMRLGLEE